MNQGTKNAVCWLWEFASPHKGGYIASLTFATLGVACGMAPYFCVAQIVLALLRGETAMGVYGFYCLLAAGFWALRYLFHGVSTSLSHQSTFAVLTQVRQRLTKKLTRLPMGYLLDTPSGRLKNILVERVDSMEPTLAHVVPEMGGNLLISIATMREEEILRRLHEAIAEFRLEPLMDRSIFALSGGEKQKIACASVSALHPEVFVLDEPSSNLDAAATADLSNMIHLWKNGGKTIVISEHRLHYLRTLVDRVVYLEKGRIAKDFTMQEFARLPVEQMEEMGLRPLFLERLSPPRGKIPLKKADAVAFSKLCFAYPKCEQTLNIEDLSLAKGSIAAVIGHNGAGKSTLARCTCGLEKRCRGELCFGAHTVKSRACLRHCYMVMQDVNHQLFAESVLDEVLLSMEREDVEKAERILDSLHLLELKDLHPMSLSGGQKQRVAIAAAVASEREIILFDEPTSGLDLRHMQEVAKNLQDLGAQGKTLLVITHDPELIAACCTDILHLERGQVTAQYPLDGTGVSRMLSFFLDAADRERQVV